MFVVSGGYYQDLGISLVDPRPQLLFICFLMFCLMNNNIIGNLKFSVIFSGMSKGVYIKAVGSGPTGCLKQCIQS